MGQEMQVHELSLLKSGWAYILHMTKGMDGFKRVVLMNRYLMGRAHHTKCFKNIYAIVIKTPIICRKSHIPLGNVKYCLEDRSINYLQSFLKRQYFR